MIWENGIEKCIISYMKLIASPKKKKKNKLNEAPYKILLGLFFPLNWNESLLLLVVVPSPKHTHSQAKTL